MADTISSIDPARISDDLQSAQPQRQQYVSCQGHMVFEDDVFDRLRMPGTPHWCVVWSDLMMTMFILFVVLYTYQVNVKEVLIETVDKSGVVVEVQKGDVSVHPGLGVFGPAGNVDSYFDAPPKSIQKLYDLGRHGLDDEVLHEFATINLVPDRIVKIVLTGDLLFDSGQAELKPVAWKSLRKVISLLRQTTYPVAVVGHTDDLPIQNNNFDSNWELSLMRANRVARFLMQESGLPENRFSVRGHASFQPVQPNDTPENRALNRRVEIIISKDRVNAKERGSDI